MCFKRKIKEEIISDSLYKVGELVAFKRYDSLSYGRIFKVSKNEKGECIYDIQIGGECPAIIHEVEEKRIVITK